MNRVASTDPKESNGIPTSLAPRVCIWRLRVEAAAWRTLTIEVSRRIKEEWTNGRDYYALHGRPMAVLPDREVQRPSREFIEWHNEKIYAA